MQTETEVETETETERGIETEEGRHIDRQTLTTEEEVVGDSTETEKTDTTKP